jgi:predicted nucleic acid-binding protein
MAVVVDANLLITLVGNDARGDLVAAKFVEWEQSGEELHAPELCLYEVANGFTRMIAAKLFLPTSLETVFDRIANIPITYHPFSNGARVVEIALPLQRQNAYDAAYLALTESLGAELRTLDSPLYRNASGQGFRVKLVEALGRSAD